MTLESNMAPSEPNDYIQASVVIAMFNEYTNIARCLNAVLSQDLPADEYEVIVVDNASTDGSRELVQEKYPAVRLLALDANYGFVGGSNRGAEQARGTWVVFLNADTRVEGDWLRQLLAVAESQPGIGAVHAAQEMVWTANEDADGDLVVPDICRWGFVRYKSVRRSDAPFPTLHVSGASAMIRRSWILENLPVFDESFFIYAEDRDVGLRLNGEGYRVMAVPRAVIRHYQGKSAISGWKALRKARLAMRNGWRAYFKNLYVTEFLLYAPAVWLGSVLKPWEFPEPALRQLAEGLGLLFLSAVYFPAALWHYAFHPEDRRRVLSRRTRAPGWMLARLLGLRQL